MNQRLQELQLGGFSSGSGRRSRAATGCANPLSEVGHLGVVKDEPQIAGQRGELLALEGSSRR